MQEAVIKFVKNLSNGMLLIDMPTGTGKTYETRKIIEEYLKKNILQEVPLIIYVTPLKKNIDDIYNELKDDFKDDDIIFNENVLRIHANYECVLDLLLKKENEISSDIKQMPSYKNLKSKINIYNFYKEKNNFQSEIISTLLMEIRKDYEPKFRKDLEEKLKKEGKSVSKRRKLLDTKYTWIKELYPSCLIDNRSVLFMTMDKFISGNDPIIDKSYSFLTYKRLEGALIFIDEFDATKDVILNQEIEKCTEHKLDLAKLFSSIATSLKGREFPNQLFADNKKSELAFNEMKKKSLMLKKVTI